MRKRILILEDDAINQKLIELYLIETYEFNMVSSVENAIEAISKSNYDLVITDLNLGSDKDGMSFLKYLKSDTKFKLIPIVAYSGYIPPNINNEFHFDESISKPITKADFLEKIATVLEKH